MVQSQDDYRDVLYFRAAQEPKCWAVAVKIFRKSGWWSWTSRGTEQLGESQQLVNA
jgi:hypothetical protein